MKKILFVLSVLGLTVFAAVSFAQGAFVDVPTDHWAYDAVNQLQRVGIIVGYPDGTFGGKRAMTRYEFAVAIARLLPLLNGDTVINNDVDLSGYAKK
ncbi:MAG: S-layer homology domain-containing protein, partial [Abditibacteriota bacterium]|nr:S-layer homology domain-containing protein [Abditibacteriota bacterium]